MLKFSYSDKDTPIHKLNPTVKIGWVAGIVILALLIDHPIFLLFMLFSTIPVIIVGEIYREWAVMIKLTLYMGIFIVIINAFASSNGSNVLWESGIVIPLAGELNLTLEALLFGLFMVVRLMAIISAFTVFTYTVHPDDMLLVMLKMKMPYKLAIIFTLATRFIPTLAQDAVRITDARKSRGLDFDRGNLFNRLKNRASILISLLESSLERTIQIAEAMEARAFGACQNRTFYHQLKLSGFDLIAIILIGAIIILAIYTMFTGLIYFQFYPLIEGWLLSPIGWILMLLTTAVMLGLAPMAILNKRAYFDKV